MRTRLYIEAAAERFALSATEKGKEQKNGESTDVFSPFRFYQAARAARFQS